MKGFTISILFCLVLFEGCYSFLVLDEAKLKGGQPSEQDALRITLRDGSTIAVEPHHHTIVGERSNFIYGVGKRTHRYTGKVSAFAGKLFLSSLDSVRTRKIGPLNNIECYLPDSTIVQFKGKDNVMVTEEQGVGLYCIGVLKRVTNAVPFSGKISMEDIEQIEVKELSVGKTALVVAAVGLVVFVVSLPDIPGVIRIGNLKPGLGVPGN